MWFTDNDLRTCIMKKLLTILAFCFLTFALSPTPPRADGLCGEWGDWDSERGCCNYGIERNPFHIEDPSPLCTAEPRVCQKTYPEGNQAPYGPCLYCNPNVAKHGVACEATCNMSCTGSSSEEIRGCDDPRDGDKDTGCYGSTLKKDSPDRKENIFERIFERIIGKVKTFFHWGGNDKQINVDELTIPIEGDLDKLLGTESQEGTLPKLTPPGAPSEELRQNKKSYLEDYSRGILDVTSCKAPGSDDIEFAVPDVWGLKNTAVNLFSYLVRIPGAGSGPSASSKNEDGQPNTAEVGEGDFEPRLLGSVETLGCTNLSLNANATSKPTTSLAQTGSVLGIEPPSGCYGPGLCDKIEAPEKDVCLTGDYGLIGKAEDPAQPAEEDGLTCDIIYNELTCGAQGQTLTCPDGSTFLCPDAGAVHLCSPTIPSCDNSSENDLSMPPRVSFLGGPEGYTDNINEVYKIFTVPGTNFENDLFGAGDFDWTYQNVDRQDEKAMYRKLGTVQCLEDNVQQSLSLPGHGLTLDEECFEGEGPEEGVFEEEEDFLVEKTANPTRIANDELPKDISFRIKITAKYKSTNVTLANETTVTKREGATFAITTDKEGKDITHWPREGEPQINLEAGEVWETNYLITATSPEFEDSRVTDTVTVGAEAIDRPGGCGICGLIGGESGWQSSELIRILNDAGNAYGVPASVLAGILYYEGWHRGGHPRVHEFDNQTVVSASAPGGKDPYCETSFAGAKGPFQFMNHQWTLYKNAAINSGARPAGHTPEICNILDAAYAAAMKMRTDVEYRGSVGACNQYRGDPPATNACNWTEKQISLVSCRYYGACGNYICASDPGGSSFCYCDRTNTYFERYACGE